MNAAYGDVLNAIRTCDLTPWQSHSPAELLSVFRELVAMSLRVQDWAIVGDVPVVEPGQGRRGYIALVARRGLNIVAIEFERTFPRGRTVAKLLRYGREGTLGAALRQAGHGLAVYRVIAVVKGHGHLQLPEGIDALCANTPPRCYGRKGA